MTGVCLSVLTCLSFFTCLSVRCAGSRGVWELLHRGDRFFSSVSWTEVPPADVAVLVQSPALQRLHHVWRYPLLRLPVCLQTGTLQNLVFLCEDVLPVVFLNQR